MQYRTYCCFLFCFKQTIYSINITYKHKAANFSLCDTASAFVQLLVDLGLQQTIYKEISS